MTQALVRIPLGDAFSWLLVVGLLVIVGQLAWVFIEEHTDWFRR